MFDQAATKELETLTPTRVARSVIDQPKQRRVIFRPACFDGLR